MGLIVEEDPVNRVFVTLSKKRNLPELHSIDDEDSAMGRGNADRALLRWHIRKRFRCRGSRAKNVDTTAHGPAGRVLDRVTNTLLTGLRTLC
jgi:hypothetical protein